MVLETIILESTTVLEEKQQPNTNFYEVLLGLEINATDIQEIVLCFKTSPLRGEAEQVQPTTATKTSSRIAL